jgi:hypothetical protein
LIVVSFLRDYSSIEISVSELSHLRLEDTTFLYEIIFNFFNLGVHLSSSSSESTSEKKIIRDEKSEEVASIQEYTIEVSLSDYELGRSLFSIPFHPFLHHALKRKGVGIATRTQLALFSHTQKHPQLFFPLNRGGGRFVALCLLVLDRALKGERFLIVVSNKILRKYVASDLESLGAFCPLEIAVFNDVHDKMTTAIKNNHIVVTSGEGLAEMLKETEHSVSELIVIEPERHDPDDIVLIQKTVRAPRLLGLYQKEKDIDTSWFSVAEKLRCVSYNTEKKSKKIYFFQQENLTEQIQKIVLYVDAPMLLVCSSEDEARSLYASLAQQLSLLRHLPDTSLRRNKEQAYRLLSNKKIQLIVIASGEYSKKVSFPVIFVGSEPPKTEGDCYWIGTEEPENLDEMQTISLPSLEVLREKSQQRITHELQKSILSPVAQDVELLYEALKDNPELLKAALKDSLQYQNCCLFEQKQEALRIEEKEAFARKKNWSGHSKRRRNRR